LSWECLLVDLDEHHNLEGIPTFRQLYFDFTSDVGYNLTAGRADRAHNPDLASLLNDHR